MVRCTLVTFQADDSWPAKALTCRHATTQIEGAEHVTLAFNTSIARRYIPESVFALVTLTTLYVLLAFTLAVIQITLQIRCIRGTQFKAFTCATLDLGNRIAPIAGQTVLTLVACRVINAVGAHSGVCVAVSDRIGIDVAIACALLTL